jgi:hypothetical protein
VGAAGWPVRADERVNAGREEIAEARRA